MQDALPPVAPTEVSAGAEAGAPAVLDLDYKARRRRQNPDRTRHGARNQDKAKAFVRWLAATFPHELREDGEGEAGDADDARGPILDVAGGKGEVAARLCVCHRRRVILVDPRPADPLACFRGTVLRKLPLKWQERLQAKGPAFLEGLLASGVSQLVTTFDEATLQQQQPLQDAVRSSCLLLGLHADGATEPIVDAALRYHKPFVVVPCCVFPRLFPQRTVAREGDNDGGDPVPVRTVDQFCRYLLAKDPRLRSATLPFEGRNVAVYWDGRG